LAKFIKGEVVVIPFPFSDLTQAKRRPALVLAELEGDDLILCQITSQAIKDNYIIPITDVELEKIVHWESWSNVRRRTFRDGMLLSGPFSLIKKFLRKRRTPHPTLSPKGRGEV